MQKSKRGRGTMKLLDASTGLMECTVCGARPVANLKRTARGTFYERGAWQCLNRDDGRHEQREGRKA